MAIRAKKSDIPKFGGFPFPMLPTRQIPFENPQLPAGQSVYNEQEMKKQVIDVLWNKLFYIFELPAFDESGAELLNGWSKAGTGGSLSTSGTTNNRLVMQSGGTINNNIIVARDPNNQGFITYSKEQRLRTAFQIDLVTDVEAYLTRGAGNSDDYYGFKLSNSTLYGVTRKGAGAEQTVVLVTISTGTVYTLEAIFSPTGRVDFNVKDETSGTKTTGSISGNLPVGVDVNFTLFYASLKNTTTSTQKIMEINYFEYLQER